MKRFEDHVYAKFIFAGMALVFLGFGWAFAISAIDTGSLWQYLTTFVLIGLAVRAAVYLIKSFKT